MRPLATLFVNGRHIVDKARNKTAGDDYYFLSPEKLYERACALDPHTDAFSRWMDWAARESIWQIERIAELRLKDLLP